jgi:hypothetical protein
MNDEFDLEDWKDVLNLDQPPNWNELQEHLARALGLSIGSGWEVILPRVIDVAKLSNISLERGLTALLTMIGRPTYHGQSLYQAIETARQREVTALALDDPQASWDHIRAAHLAAVGLTAPAPWTWLAVLELHEARLKLPKLGRPRRGDVNSQRWQRWDRWDRVFQRLIADQGD